MLLDILVRSRKCVHTGVRSFAIVRIFYPCNYVNHDCLYVMEDQDLVISPIDMKTPMFKKS